MRALGRSEHGCHSRCFSSNPAVRKPAGTWQLALGSWHLEAPKEEALKRVPMRDGGRAAPLILT